jgi:hypothetical protein
MLEPEVPASDIQYHGGASKGTIGDPKLLTVYTVIGYEEKLITYRHKRIRL